jgi:hypothetical protein
LFTLILDDKNIHSNVEDELDGNDHPLKYLADNFFMYHYEIKIFIFICDDEYDV